MKMYYAFYSYTFPSLAEFEVEKETPSRFYPKHRTVKMLFGDNPGFYGNFIEKRNPHLFNTPQEGYQYLLKKAREKLASAAYLQGLATGFIERLTEALNAIQDQSSEQA